jgi:hypothetical protein
MKHIEAFTYLFRQPHFVMTLLVGSVMFFIPVVGPLVLMGWAVTVHHALMKGEQVIPALTFDDFSKLLNLGVGPFVVSLLFSTILSFVLMPLLMLPLFGISMAIPFALQSGGNETTALITVLAIVILMVVFFFVAVVALTIPNKVILIYCEMNPALNDSFKSLSFSYV